MKAGKRKGTGPVLTKKEQELLDALTPKATEEGVDLVTLEVVGAKKAPTIRVYIDTDHGVGFDELASAQSWINDIMDAIDPFPGAYTLEVSSPGIDRPLRTRQHFERFAGENVVVKTVSPLEGRSTFSGVLVGVEDDSVVVECDGVRHAIPLGSVKKANVKGTYDFR